MLSIVNETETKVFQQNQLTVKIFPTVQQMGKAAAQEVACRSSFTRRISTSLDQRSAN